MPSALVSWVALRASSIVVPATNLPDTRCPRDELSAMCRKVRLSERAMKAALNIGVLTVGFSCVWTNTWFYHKPFMAVICGLSRCSDVQIAAKSPTSGGGAREANDSLYLP